MDQRAPQAEAPCLAPASVTTWSNLSRSCLIRASLLLLIPVVLGACFPTMQTPEITPGLHLDAGAMVLGDFGRPTTPRTLVDLFVTARVRVGRR